jgi:ferric-dicitrate binding protein FerR (iron transport regulator)
VGTLTTAGNLTVSRNTTPDAFFAWTEGRLVFHDTPLSQALSQLDRWYDVRFTLTDRTLAQRPLTASFDTESLSQVLDVLQLTLDLDIRRSGDTVALAPRARGNQ